MTKSLKRVIFVVLTICVVLSVCVLSASAADNSTMITTDKIYFEDGSYAVEILEVSPNYTRSKTKSASKIYRRYDSNDVLQYTFTLKGTFSYTGSSATATSSSTSYSISNSAWSCKSRSSICSGNSVTGKATFKNGWVTYSPSLKLTCSATGVIS